jgi:hypothetical protein
MNERAVIAARMARTAACSGVPAFAPIVKFNMCVCPLPEGACASSRLSHALLGEMSKMFSTE